MTLSRAAPPFRADHVGSLLRPPELLAARERWRAGELDDDGLRELEDAAIRDIVRDQEAIGLDGVTDGEFRRDYWHLDFMWRFDGVAASEEAFTTPFSGGTDFTAPAAKVTGKIAYPAVGIMGDHFAFLKSVTGRTAKFTIPAPGMFRQGSGRRMIDADAYPEIDAFWADLGRAYNDAVHDLAARGCTYLQLDDVNSCILCDRRVRDRMAERNQDPDHVLGLYIALNNAAITGRPAGMTVTTHMCRGNFRSEYAAAGGYEAVAERFLAEMDVDGFFMEYDTDRAGDFAPLRFLPEDKFAVLGLVSSKSAELESADALKRRIDEAARFAPLERLCLSPQCGFSSTHHGNLLTRDDQRRKLERIVEVAADVWG
ncbi:MAG: 5-methyltetrahydropteroyltriglutamate--homocysteine S-methyltransferase [Alphaproteobacteria bacterium]|nr:5-methyltetrahydropteroyltriglutamate--homocysteine S-methyltransferase [Alphaproteobacteria bacterium]